MKIITIQKLLCLFAVSLFLSHCGTDDAATPQGLIQYSIEGGSVSVMRGQANQPSIKVTSAGNKSADEIGLAAFGCEQAKDRFFQMRLLGYFVMGRTSEVFGEKSAVALKNDKLITALGLPQSVENSERKIRNEFPEDFKLIEAFTRGVNACLPEAAKLHPEWLIAFSRLTGAKNVSFESAEAMQAWGMSPWTTIDSVAALEGAIFQLSSNSLQKIIMGAFALQIAQSDDKFAEKLPEISGDGYASFYGLWDFRTIAQTFIVGGAVQNLTNIPAQLASGNVHQFTKHLPLETASAIRNMAGCKEMSYPFPPCIVTSGYGSNNGVVGGKAAAGGGSILMNDTHMALANIFYEYAIDTTAAGGTFHFSGVTLVGLLAGLSGHNGNISMGMTNLFNDADDIYMTKISKDGKQYFFKDHWHLLRIEKRTLQVRNHKSGLLEPSEISIRYDNHGPLFNEFIDKEVDNGFISVTGALEERNNTDAESQVALSYKWVGHPGTTEIISLFRVNRAKNLDEVEKGLNYLVVGSQNVVAGDRFGNILYKTAGYTPVRKYISKAVPPFTWLDGTGAHEWESGEGYVFPSLKNPEKNYIVTANNDVTGVTAFKDMNNFSDYHSTLFSTGFRAERLSNLIQEDMSKKMLEITDLQRYQFDHYDMQGYYFIENILRSNEDVSRALSPAASQVLTKLLAWKSASYQSSRNRIEPRLFYMWHEDLVERYFADLFAIDDIDSMRTLLKDTFDLLLYAPPVIKTTYHRIVDGLASEDERDKYVTRLIASLERVAKIANGHGGLDVRWGSVNRFSFTNIFKEFFELPNNESFERDGAWDTVDVSRAGVGPNFRMTIHLKPNGEFEAWNSLPGGNYTPLQTVGFNRELLQWRNGEVRPLMGWH